MSGAGFFQLFVAPQNHKSWFVVSMYNAGGVQLPTGAPLPIVAPFPPPDPLIWLHVPGDPVAVQKNRFCPAAASVAKYICPRVQAAGRSPSSPVFTGAVTPAPLKSTAETVPLTLSVPL
jgi:hypothetical protein